MRARWLLLAALVAGCERPKLEALQVKMEAAQAQRVKAQAAVSSLELEVSRAEQALQAMESRAAQEHKRLGQAREALAEHWSGDPERLEALLAGLENLPLPLKEALEQAQRQAAHTTREQRFAKAIRAGDLPGLADALQDWEARAGVEVGPGGSMPGLAIEEVCLEERQAHPECEPGPGADPLALCRVEGAGLTLAVWSERGRLVFQPLQGVGKGRAKLLRGLAPRVWAVEVESLEPEERGVPQLGRLSARRWLKAYELGEHSGASWLSLPLEGEQTPVLLYLDLDGDGADELAWVMGREVRALHAVGERDVELWPRAKVCPKVTGTAPLALRSACAD